MYVLGIDAGATKTECMLARGDGTILAQALGPGANFQLFSVGEVERVVSDLTERVLGGGPRPVDVMCAGVAGAGRQTDFEQMRRVLHRIGCARENLVTHDALIALVAGAERRYGVVLTVGTGAAIYGISRAGAEARAGGWGPLLGDEGSAYWMGLRVLQSIVRASDGRAQPTLLERPVLETLGIDGIDSLVHRVYRELARDEVAALAPLVQSAADRGDPAAQSIIDEAIREFVRGVESVIGRLGMAGERFRLVLSGGLWKAVPVLKQDLAGIVPKIAPWAEVHELTVEPARGAVAMALEVAHAKGLAPTPPSVQRL